MSYLNTFFSRKAAISFFATLMLISAVVAQDLRTDINVFDTYQNAKSDRGTAIFGEQGAMLTPVLTITPLTWGVIGLDSNDVTDGPNLYPVGARVCNTGTTAATNVVTTFNFTSANALINLRTGSVGILSLPTLNAGACTDSYFEVEITRTATAYNTTRGFRIDATANTLGTVSTPAARELFVEKLVSQNRNSVTSIKLNGATIPFGGTMTLSVGNTYTIDLTASTATNGYEQIESFINLPNVIFQTLSIATTYTAPTGYTGDKLYEDGCTWDPVVGSATYRSCLATGKTGGNVTMRYVVKILSGAGTSRNLNTLIYDFSGSSYHYNNDYSTTFVVAQIVPPVSASGASVSGRLLTADGNGIRNAVMFLTEENGTVHTTRSSTFGYYRFEDIPVGQSVVVSVASKRYTFSPNTRIVNLTDEIVDMDWMSID